MTARSSGVGRKELCMGIGEGKVLQWFKAKVLVGLSLQVHWQELVQVVKVFSKP